MEDTDMFLTQAQDVDDMYISLATAVTIRKCKVDQKKEKLKLLAKNIKKKNEELKLAKKDTETLKKEKEEAGNQKILKVINLNGEKESCTSLEAMLCDLNNKVVFTREETKRKADEYKAAMQNATETWEAYEKIYKEFPLAKEVEKITLEIKKVDIEVKRTVNAIEDVKYKKKLKADIREKRRHIWIVQLAKGYLKIQEKIAERDNLLNKISDLKKQIEDLEAGKSTRQQAATQNTPRSIQIQNVVPNDTQKILQITMPEIQLYSPPPLPENTPTRAGAMRWFNLENLLGYNNTINLSRNKQVDVAKTTENLPANKVVTQTKVLNKVLSDTQKGKKDDVYTSVKSSGKVYNVLTSQQKKTDNRIKEKVQVNKTKLDNQSNELNQPPRKVLILQDSLSKTDVNISKIKTTDSANSISGNFTQREVIQNKKPNENFRNQREITKLDCNLNSLSSIKAYMSSLAGDSNQTPTLSQARNPTQHTEHALSVQESLPEYNQEKHSQQTGNAEHLPATDKQPDNISNFTSPIELDDAAKLVYQRLAAESPGFVYPRGPDLMSSQKTTADMSAGLVRSQYFNNVASPPSQFSAMATQGDYQPLQYSPPVTSNSLLSPPAGNLDVFNFGKNTSELSFDISKNKDKSPKAGFSFNFMSSSSKSGSSFFNLF